MENVSDKKTPLPPEVLEFFREAGREGGRKGGKIRMDSMTDEEKRTLALKGVEGRRKKAAKKKRPRRATKKRV